MSQIPHRYFRPYEVGTGLDDDDPDQEESLSPEEARRQERIAIAQRKRDKGDSTWNIAADVGMSHTWVVENTRAPEGDV